MSNDPIGDLMRRKGIGFPEAVEELAANSNIARLPVQNKRRLIAPPTMPTRLLGAANDLILIATEHDFDRDGIREIAARLKRFAEELSAS